VIGFIVGMFEPFQSLVKQLTGELLVLEARRRGTQEAHVAVTAILFE
jgi:hypothetical protein